MAKKYHLCNEEKEVIINFCRAEEYGSLYSSDPVWIRKMDKLCKEHPESFKVIKCEYYQGEPISKDYSFPIRLLSMRSKDVKIELSEDEKKKRAERMRRLHQERK